MSRRSPGIAMALLVVLASRGPAQEDALCALLLDVNAARGERREALLVRAGEHAKGLVERLRAERLPQPLRPLACEALSRSPEGRRALIDVVEQLGLSSPAEVLQALGKVAATADADGQVALDGLLDLLTQSCASAERPHLAVLATALGESGSASAAPALAEGLCTEPSQLRPFAEALLALGQVQPAATTESLLTAASDLELPVEHRAWVHVVLGELGSPGAVDALSAALDEAVRTGAASPAEQAAALALGKIATPAANQALLSVEARAAEPLRTWAIEALAGSVNAPQAPDLVRKLQGRVSQVRVAEGEGPTLDAFLGTLRVLTGRPGASYAELREAPALVPAAYVQVAEPEPAVTWVDGVLLALVLALPLAIRAWVLRRAERRGEAGAGGGAAALATLLLVGLGQVSRGQAQGAVHELLRDVDTRVVAGDELQQRLMDLRHSDLQELARSLEHLPRPEVLRALAAIRGGEELLLEIARAPGARNVALEALGECATERALEPLFDLMMEADAADQERTGRAFSQVLMRANGGEASRWRAALRCLVADTLHQPQGAGFEAGARALATLVDVDGWRAADDLRAALLGPLRRQALNLLAGLPLDDGEAVGAGRELVQPVVLDIVRAPDSGAVDHALALQALGVWGDQECLGELLTALEGESEAVQANARRALERLTGEKLESVEGWRRFVGSASWRSDRMDALLAALDDRTVTGRARDQAIRAVGKLRDPRAIELLLRLLEQRPPEQDALSACVALAYLSDDRALNPLDHVANDPGSGASNALRERAAWAWRAIRGERPGDGGPPGSWSGIGTSTAAANQALSFARERASAARPTAPSRPAAAAAPPSRFPVRLLLLGVAVLLVAIGTAAAVNEVRSEEQKRARGHRLFRAQERHFTREVTERIALIERNEADPESKKHGKPAHAAQAKPRALEPVMTAGGRLRLLEDLRARLEQDMTDVEFASWTRVLQELEKAMPDARTRQARMSLVAIGLRRRAGQSVDESVENLWRTVMDQVRSDAERAAAVMDVAAIDRRKADVQAEIESMKARLELLEHELAWVEAVTPAVVAAAPTPVEAAPEPAAPVQVSNEQELVEAAPRSVLIRPSGRLLKPSSGRLTALCDEAGHVSWQAAPQTSKESRPAADSSRMQPPSGRLIARSSARFKALGSQPPVQQAAEPPRAAEPPCLDVKSLPLAGLPKDEPSTQVDDPTTQAIFQAGSAELQALADIVDPEEAPAAASDAGETVALGLGLTMPLTAELQALGHLVDPDEPSEFEAMRAAAEAADDAPAEERPVARAEAAPSVVEEEPAVEDAPAVSANPAPAMDQVMDEAALGQGLMMPLTADLQTLGDLVDPDEPAAAVEEPEAETAPEQGARVDDPQSTTGLAQPGSAELQFLAGLVDPEDPPTLLPGQESSAAATPEALALGRGMLAPATAELKALAELVDPDESPGAPAIPPGEFKLLRPLGRGSQASVWEAVGHDGERVAIKLLPIHAGEASTRRFIREAELATELDSPYIVKVHGLRTTRDDRGYLVMDLVKGTSLAERLGRSALAMPEVLRLADHMARALVAAADKGVVHRDITPHNVLLSVDGTARLTDFGIGKQEGAETGLTRSGASMGTLPYMAPEQVVDAKSVTLKVDIYSCAATLYHAVTGRPILVPEQFQTLHMSLEETVRTWIRARPRPTSLRRDCPPELEALLDEMLHEDPAERPSAREVLRSVERLRRKMVPTA